jgi:hypothetical protein
MFSSPPGSWPVAMDEPTTIREFNLPIRAADAGRTATVRRIRSIKNFIVVGAIVYCCLS